MEDNYTSEHATIPTPRFIHPDLDQTRPSIRVVKILASRDPSDHIQCIMSCTTIESTYACLSYQWGNADSPRDILLNGKLFAIRQNLYDFLDSVQGHLIAIDAEVSQVYWIDALCINQTDQIERNHQVAQMGKIYSNAEEVVVWLGHPHPRVVRILESRHVLGHPFFLHLEFDTSYPDRVSLIEYLVLNDYWKRAWITQELVLARRRAIWTGMSALEMSTTLGTVLALRAAKNIEDSFLSHLRGIMDIINETYTADSLIMLLGQFQNKECEVFHDRVYSLLSLCKAYRHSIDVDYSISKAALVLQVLHQDDKALCLCHFEIVAHSLRLEPPSPLVDALQSDTPYVELRRNGIGRTYRAVAYGVMSQSFAIQVCQKHRSFELNDICDVTRRSSLCVRCYKPLQEDDDSIEWISIQHHTPPCKVARNSDAPIPNNSKAIAGNTMQKFADEATERSAVRVPLWMFGRLGKPRQRPCIRLSSNAAATSNSGRLFACLGFTSSWAFRCDNHVSSIQFNAEPLKYSRLTFNNRWVNYARFGKMPAWAAHRKGYSYIDIVNYYHYKYIAYPAASCRDRALKLLSRSSRQQ